MQAILQIGRVQLLQRHPMARVIHVEQSSGGEIGPMVSFVANLSLMRAFLSSLIGSRCEL